MKVSGHTTPPVLAPLSFQQEETVGNMLRFPDQAGRYDQVLLYRLDGDIDVDLLSLAVADVTNHHDVLRTRVVEHHGEYRQRVTDKVGRCPILAHPEGSTTDWLAQTLVAQRHTTASALADEPLFRPAVHLADGAILLELTIHHLCYDEWSLHVLTEHLSACYAARAVNDRAVLPPQRPYTDFVDAQRAAWERYGDEVVAFWRARIGDTVEELTWPAAGNPTDTCLTVHVVDLPDGTNSFVREMSRQCRVTRFMILLSASAIALGRVTGSRHLLVSSDTANREAAWKHHAIGMYLNTKLTPVQLDVPASLTAVVRSIRETWLDGERYRECYTDRILGRLGLPRPVNVQLPDGDDAVDPAPIFPGVIVTPVELRLELRTWRDLYFLWARRADGFALELHYTPARVHPAVVRELGEATIDLLSSPRHPLKPRSTAPCE